MKITLLAIGKTNTKYLQEGIEQYIKRLSHYIPFEFKILPDVKTTKGLTQEKQKEMEGQMFLNCIQSGDVVVLLDEKGKEMTSREFSVYLDKKMVTVAKNLIFVIGGPYGFSQEIYNRANEKLSLSKMTFSHEMIRMFFIEQIYRAMTILKGEPYHHD
ncbi:MAG: 23S rRNA (pseudouridine(1915)-N(3))-methyltransferase RlmH [Muribaculaceae bacterium]|nr:23S rRNA (pseudouridine(1915)-N(3))-methyltransferase RlmH [Muribaculaceae bacterium]